MLIAYRFAIPAIFRTAKSPAVRATQHRFLTNYLLDSFIMAHITYSDGDVIEFKSISQHQIDSYLQQGAQQQHGQLVDDIAALLKAVAKKVRYVMTLEMPVFLSSTLHPPTMVSVSKR
ncbi:MAG: hypothetical protein V7752_08880 [Halopseudomonas sp.]